MSVILMTHSSTKDKKMQLDRIATELGFGPLTGGPKRRSLHLRRPLNADSQEETGVVIYLKAGGGTAANEPDDGVAADDHELTLFFE